MVTSVYDSNGRQKTTIGSYGTGPLQFNGSTGIAISGDIMYVVEHNWVADKDNNID